MHRLTIALTFAACLPAALAAQETRNITGQVTYLDRMALPDDALLLVEVSDSAGDLIAEIRQPSAGNQAPLSFAVDVPDLGEDPVLRAGIVLGADLVWLGDPVTAHADRPAELILRRYQPIGFNATYRCGDDLVRTGHADDALVMDTGTMRVTLQPVATASGARYDAVDDPGTFFWNRGASALVSVADQDWPDCQIALPPMTDVYSAFGTEPFWNVALLDGVMTVTRLDQDDLALHITEAGLTQDGAITVSANGGATLLRENALCRDAMAGMSFPETVTLTLGDTVLQGCGGDSRDLFIGRDWAVTDIAGMVVPDDIDVSLRFDRAGRVAGAAGCNRWFASYDLTGEGLMIGQAGATMMACADGQMAIERAFLDALEQVSGFQISDDGALILTAAEAPLIVTAAP
jgi:heat shock protein HslJ